MREDSRAPAWATPGTVPSRASIWAFAVYAVYQGCGIVIGGMDRWGGPAYTFLRQAPGAPDSWGWAIAIAGITLMAASAIRSWWLKLFALVGISTWSFGFAVGAQLATVNVPTAGTTGGPVYMLTVILAAILVLPDESRKAL